MNNYETPVLNNAFSRIYVEEAVLAHERTLRVLKRFPEAAVVTCKSYKDIFCRTNQAPALQKTAPALILAEAHAPYCYKGAAVCQSFDEEHFYYTSSVMNCIYDCEYCYLQGMYPSGHLVLFVNLEDTFAEIDRLLQEHSMYVCISYDTDLFALEGITGLLAEWYAFAASRPTLTLEVRTKCSARSTLASLPALPNVILALTLSPDAIISRYEQRTPSLEARLRLGEQALASGHPLRLCFDPMLYVSDYHEQYGALFREAFSRLPGGRLRDVSLGVFRISKDYLKNMRHVRPCGVTYYPYELTNGVYHYGSKRSKELLNFAKEQLLPYISPDKLFIWEDYES